MKIVTDSTVMTSPEYRRFIEELKARVISARISAARAVNCDHILLYWDIGRGIVERQHVLGWGDAVVEMVSTDLQAAFPLTTGFSPRNLRSAKQFYLAYADPAIWLQPAAKLTEAAVIEFLRQLVAQIPWGQNLLILNKLTDPATRLYYLRATARFGWTRNVLLNQIKAGAYQRAVTEKKTHNFPLALPEHLAEQADEMLKVPTTSNSSASAAPSRNANSKTASSNACAISSSNSVTAFASSDGSTGSRSERRSISSTCFFTTASSGRWSRSISKSARSSRNTPARWISIECGFSRNC